MVIAAPAAGPSVHLVPCQSGVHAQFTKTPRPVRTIDLHPHHPHYRYLVPVSLYLLFRHIYIYILSPIASKPSPSRVIFLIFLPALNRASKSYAKNDPHQRHDDPPVRVPGCRPASGCCSFRRCLALCRMRPGRSLSPRRGGPPRVRRRRPRDPLLLGRRPDQAAV